MTVEIDPSEARQRPIARRRWTLTLPLLGVGTAGLVAFAFTASSFFSGLADPRIRPMRPNPIAAQWPDLKDGVPALADATPAGASAAEQARQPVSALAEPLPDLSQPALPQPVTASAPAPAQAAPRAEGRAPQVDRALQIETVSVATAESALAPVLAPTRITAALTPARSETVRARAAATPSSFVSLLPKTTAAAPPTEAAQKRRSVRAAPAKPTGSPQAVADASAASPAAEPAAQPPQDEEVLGVKIPGAAKFREGLQALGDVFADRGAEN